MLVLAGTILVVLAAVSAALAPPLLAALGLALRILILVLLALRILALALLVRVLRMLPTIGLLWIGGVIAGRLVVGRLLIGLLLRFHRLVHKGTKEGSAREGRIASDRDRLGCRACSEALCFSGVPGVARPAGR